MGHATGMKPFGLGRAIENVMAAQAAIHASLCARFSHFSK
jgi:hypothetical protein